MKDDHHTPSLCLVLPAVFDLPIGGAKLGVTCDPRQMSLRMQERLVRKLTSVSDSQLTLGAGSAVTALNS